MEPNPSAFDFWIDPTALTILGCVGLVVAGLVALVAITSWQNVRIAQATGRDPRKAMGTSPGPQTVDRIDGVGHPSGGSTN